MPAVARHIGLLLHDFHLGGSERIAIRLAREWASRGRQVTLFVGEDRGALRDMVGPAMAVDVFGQQYQRSTWQIYRLARWAARRATFAGIDAMFLPGNSYFRAIPRLGRELAVITKLSNPIVRPGKSKLRNLVFPLATAWRWRKLHSLVAMCEGHAAEIRQQVSSRVPVTVIPDPILDTPPVAPAAAKVPGQLCAVGRLELQKNYRLMLDAFTLLRDLPVTLRIAGDGNLRAELEALAMRLGLADRVQFLGTVCDAAPLMAQSEALLLSSDYEGYPAVCVEALAAGTYVIARDCGSGVREILRAARTGTLVTAATPQALAAAVRGYWQHRGFDAAAARAVASSHVMGPIAERYLQLLDAAVAARR